MLLKGGLGLISFSILAIMATKAIKLDEDPYEDCGSNHNSTQCFGLPKDCFYTKNCSLWVKFSACDFCGDVTFHLFGNNLDSKSYISVGLSEGNPMRNGSVVFCHAAGIGMSWNQVGDNGYESIVLGNTTGIFNAETSLDENGTLSCSFKRQKVTQIHTQGITHEFDLGVKEKYILALAKGPIHLEMLHVELGVHGMSHKEDIGHTHYRIDFNPGSDPTLAPSTVEPTTTATTDSGSATPTNGTLFLVVILTITVPF